jgi:formate hydrogenlyase transcriptional activator
LRYRNIMSQTQKKRGREDTAGNLNENMLDTGDFSQAVLDSLDSNIAVLDADGQIVAVNEAWLRFTRENGETQPAGIGPGVNYLEVCRLSNGKDSDIAREALDGIQSVLDGSRDLFTLEYPCHSPKLQRWFVMKVRPLTCRRGGAIVSHTDITDRKKVDDSVDDLRRRLSFMQDVGEGIWDWNVMKGEVYCSPRLLQALGYPSDKLTTDVDFWRGIVHPEDSLEVEKAMEEHLAGRNATFDHELRLRLGSGQYRWTHSLGKVVEWDDGRPLRMIGIDHDITKRKQREEDLRNAYAEAERLKNLLEAENVYLSREMSFELGFEEIIGESPALKHVLNRVSQVAPTDMTVLILGETGTGKGQIAYSIHNGSNRREGPLIHVNCAALPSNLIESELFGREKGAYTGAESRQFGRFELADHGTIFLDEIGELPLELQAKLLRVIEERKFERLGSPRTLTVDVRIIASTNRNLEDDIKKGRFREDLYFRLNVFPIEVPPLSQRDGDISLLVQCFIKRFNGKYGKEIKRVSKSTMDALQSYSWPGNVRELASVIERAVITSHGTTLDIVERIGTSFNMKIERPHNKNLLDVERAHIISVLEETGWRVEGAKGAARILGINPSTLRTRMRKLAIIRPKGR